MGDHLATANDQAHISLWLNLGMTTLNLVHSVVRRLRYAPPPKKNVTYLEPLLRDCR